MELGRSVASESLGALITLVGMSQHCIVVVYIVMFFFLFISCEFNLISYYARKKHGLTLFFFSHKEGTFVTKWIKSCLLLCFGTFKMPFLMFISILVFCPEDKNLEPCKARHKDLRTENIECLLY